MSVRVTEITPPYWAWRGCNLILVAGWAKIVYDAPYIPGTRENAFLAGDVFTLLVDGRTVAFGATPRSGEAVVSGLGAGTHTAVLLVHNSSVGINEFVAARARVSFTLPDPGPQPPPPPRSRIVLRAVTWPGLRFVSFYGFSYLPWPGGVPLTPCSDTVAFTVPRDVFGRSTRLLGVDLSAAGDAAQRMVGECSGIRRVYVCHVRQTPTGPQLISTSEPGVSPVFPLTQDGLEGVVVGGGMYERPVPWGHLYLASRPAAGVRQTLAEGVIYMGTDGQARGFLVFGGGGNLRKVEVVDGQAFSVVDIPFYTQLGTAYVEAAGKVVLLYGSLPRKRVRITARLSGSVGESVLRALLDGTQVGTTRGPDGTYVFESELGPGNYTATVVARDQAGREASDRKQFTVSI